jgi:CDP-glucose 4,6-dehydratase
MFGQRVFLTGATGFIGSWLTKKLTEQGIHVVALVSDWNQSSELIRSRTIHKLDVVIGTLEDLSLLKQTLNNYQVDTVFHLAAVAVEGKAYQNPIPAFEANIRGTYNLLEACRANGSVRQVVVASSDKAYGDSAILPYTEELPPLGRHPYDVSKSCADLIAQTYHHTYGLPVAIGRFANIFGGGDLNWSRIVPGTIRHLLKGERPVLRSDGTFTRDYLYVEDVVNAYLSMADGLDKDGVAGEAFNFGLEKPYTVLEIVDALRKLMNREDLEPLILNQSQAEIRDQYQSTKKAQQVLSWQPQYSLLEGLKKTIAWYQEFLGQKP